MQAIEELHTSRGTTGITNKDTFNDIAAYFKTLLLNVCSDNKIQLHKWYPMLVVPDEWKVETNDMI
jgi:hypothetical protein